jgi:hypothetical protein
MFSATALVVTALAPLLDAAAGTQQVRSSAGYGAISGRVEIVETDQRAPLRRATVTLRSESGTLTKTIATDANGAYRFESLAAGKYRVTVQKAGFLCAVLTTPGIDPGNPFPESSLAAGAQLVVNFIAQRAGALEGRLIEDTGKPIAGLALSVERLADGSGQATAGSYPAKTDDLGRFRVHTLPSGRYRVSATPPSPASGTRLYYPGTEKIEDGEILVVSPGQTLENLTFVVATGSLPAVVSEAMATQELDALSAPTGGGRWAEITGRVTRSDAGQPIPNAAVKLSTSAGALLRTAWTDGAGEYSFRRVIAGSYLVTVSADGFANPDASPSKPTGGARITVADGQRLKRELVLTPLSAIEGRVLDEFSDPAPGVFLRVSSQATVVNPAEARPASSMTAVTDDRGGYRISGLFPAEYLLTALPEPFGLSGPTAFPITSMQLQLAAGIDAHGVNFVLPAAPTTVVSGTVVDTTGRRMPNTLVTLSPVVDGLSKGLIRAPVNPDVNGNFVYPNVPAGTYLVEAREPRGLAIGSLTIATPIEPFSLTLKPLPTARGRVTFEGEAPPEIKPQLREILLHSLVRFQPAGTLEDFYRFGRPGVVEPDWTFQIQGLSSAGVIRTSEEFMGWSLARVLMQGRDITDVVYDFQSGDVDGIEVVLTRRVGGVTGTVADRGINPIAVVVFGADGDSWPYLSRTLRAVQPNLAGVFTVDGLLPGRYFAVAVRSGTPRSGEEALRALRSLATPVVVTQGVYTAIKLTIVK